MAKKFDKYYYYMESVQSPETDVEFFQKTFKELKKRDAESFREDFCGTFMLSQEWIKLDKKHTSYGVDLDPEPIEYGKKLAEDNLDWDQRERLRILNKNVLDSDLPHTDLVAACNFSYFIFKTRKQLREYFENCYNTLKDDGLFIVDIFGGSQCYEPNEEETEHDGFSYFWDQDSYDPVNNHAQFYIHFQVDGEKKQEKCFSYDWRMWSIPEVREVMAEAGFRVSHVYWEGTDDDGEGDGEFERVEVGEDCESWIAYIVAEK